MNPAESVAIAQSRTAAARPHTCSQRAALPVSVCKVVATHEYKGLWWLPLSVNVV